MTHDELRSLTGVYALGALSGAERRELEAHLATCDECSREVAECVQVADGLAYAVPPHDPPASLRDRVLRTATASTDSGRVVDLKSRPVRSALPTWFAVAASIAAVALGLYAMTLRQRIDSLQQNLREANIRAETLQREATVAHATAQRATQTAAILSADDVRRIDLAGQKTAPGSSGTAFWSASRRQLLLSARDLPTLREGRQYQAWVIPPGSSTPVSAGMLDLTSDGRVSVLASTSTVNQVGTVAISEEPVGGSPGPTGPIVLAGSQ
jgi:anti-sigma-K factor RskA